MPMSADCNPIASVSLSSHDMPSDHKIAAWKAAANLFFDTDIRDPETFSSSVKAYLLDKIVVTVTEFKAQSFNRTQRHIKLGTCEHMVLELYLRGEGRGCLGNEIITMCPQRVNLLDYSYPLSTKVSDASLISFVIPQELIQPSCPVSFWDTTLPTGRILSSFIRELWGVLPKMKQQEGEDLATALLGLLNGLMRPSNQRTNYEQACVESASLAAIQSYMEENLHLPILNGRYLCNVFNISRATLYRLFKDLGGVENYLKNQRLNRAFYKLARGSPGQSKTPIYTIAVECGFTDPAYFSRVFKQMFGYTPSEVFYGQKDRSVEACLTHHDQSVDQIEIFKRWLIRN